MKSLKYAILAAVAAFPALLHAQQAKPNYERDCVEGFNRILQTGSNFRDRYERARECLEMARPRLGISSTREIRAALRDNIRVYTRVMANSALTIQLADGKVSKDLSAAAFRDFTPYMASEFTDITPDNIDRFFDDTEVYAALGLFAGEYQAAADAGKRAMDVYARFRGAVWMQPDDDSPGDAPDKVSGIEVIAVLNALMREDLAAFLEIASDKPRSQMARSACRTFFAISDNPGTSGSPLALFIGENRKAFMAAVLKTASQLKSAGMEGERAAVSCASNLAAFFARLGDIETALKFYGEIAAVTMPTFDMDADLKKKVLPKLVGEIQNPLIKGEAICALGDFYAAEGETDRAGQMFGAAFKLLRESGLASKNPCWVRSACNLGKRQLKKGAKEDAYGLLSGAQEAAKAEGVFPAEKCALGGTVAALSVLGKQTTMKTELDTFLASSPSEKDFSYMLSLMARPDQQKAIYAAVRDGKPDLMKPFLLGWLVSSDPPDAAAIEAGREGAELLGNEGKLLLEQKAAKQLLAAGKGEEGAVAMLKYIRAVPQKRFKEEFLAAVGWMAGHNMLKELAFISQELDKAFMLDSEDYGNLGDLMFKSGNFKAAVHFYEKCASKHPLSFDPNLKLARARMRSGDLPGMVAAYAAAGKIGQLPRADIINLANAMVQQAKFDDAHKFLDAEIAQDRNFADALFTKGIIFSVQGQCKKAVEFYGRALFVDAKMAPAYTNMGYARLDCNEIQEAVKAFETALKLSDNKIDHFDSNLGLAIARMRLGNESAAEEHFRKALTLNPVLAGGVESLARAGYVYSAPQAEDIRKLLEKHKTSK